MPQLVPVLPGGPLNLLHLHHQLLHPGLQPGNLGAPLVTRLPQIPDRALVPLPRQHKVLLLLGHLDEGLVDLFVLLLHPVQLLLQPGAVLLH